MLSPCPQPPESTGLAPPSLNCHCLAACEVRVHLEDTRGFMEHVHPSLLVVYHPVPAPLHMGIRAPSDSFLHKDAHPQGWLASHGDSYIPTKSSLSNKVTSTGTGC